jgi:enoyl-CoA hydratase
VNALNTELRALARNALDELRDDPEIRVVVVTGAGRCFSAGQDFAEATDGISLELVTDFDELCDALASFPKPTIAAVNGPAVGGGLEVALCCDLRVASEQARFAAASASVGLIASTQRLVRIVGEAQAKRLIFTGESIGAHEAVRIGLAHEAVPHDSLAERASALASTVASKAPLALSLSKDAIHKASDLPLDEGSRLQRRYFARLAQTDDHREALRAFDEKRAPRFQGH